MESFTFSNATLYLTLLGDCYYKLIMSTKNSNNDSNDNTFNMTNKASFLNDIKCIEEFSFRCMYTYEKGLEYADENLDITDPIRLYCIVCYCRGLRDIQNNTNKARKYAKKIFLKACGHNYQIDKSSLQLLQKLRDTYLIDNIEEHKNWPHTIGIQPEYSVASSGFEYDQNNNNDDDESECEEDDDDTLESEDDGDKVDKVDESKGSQRKSNGTQKGKKKKKKK